MAIVNTQPSSEPGEHWLAFFITKQKRCYLFDSFGRSPRVFPHGINTFIGENSLDVTYSNQQVQSNYSFTCSHHCVFFLCHVQKGLSYARVMNMYGDNLICNDSMVCKFVNRIQPVVCCGYES